MSQEGLGAEDQRNFTPEAAKADVGMDHAFAAASFDAEAAILIPEDELYAPILTTREYMRKHDPEAGGYYVVYADGYKSWSPAAAFEEGYARVG